MTGQQAGSSAAFTLDGECALVTGAGAGLGKAIALALAGAGAALVLVDREAGPLGAVASAITAAGGRAESIVADVCDPESAARACEKAIAAFGRLDVLVNNAGIYPPGGVLPDIDWEAHQRTFDINVFSAMRFLAEASRHMAPGGRIINVSSMESLRPSGPGLSHYSTTKAALNAITRTAAVDLAPRGIRVNALLPGLFMTEGTSRTPPAIFETVKARAPSGRVGEPSDIAGPAVFLASPASSYVNGHCLVVDGGMTIAG